MRARVSFLRQLPLTIGYTLPLEMFAVANKHSASRKAIQAVSAVSSASVKAGLFCNRSLISLYRSSSSCSERCNSFAEHTLKSYCVFESLHSSATALDVQKPTPSHTTANMRIDVDPLVQIVREGSVNSDNCYVNGSRLARLHFKTDLRQAAVQFGRRWRQTPALLSPISSSRGAVEWSSNPNTDFPSN
jgi:hypothetical protein